ncbi:MAG: pseudouridine-5'-phosphate glycosidase [Phycisphaerales bacterium]|nr:pseudouridine-5'-phosphate glycosidase [Phycisphaerales bacterium]
MTPTATHAQPPTAAAAPHGRRRVALETTLLVHGVPPEASRGLAKKLGDICRGEGAEPAVVGVVSGRAIVGMNGAELDVLLSAGAKQVPKLNSGNLGAVLFRGGHGATTVSATMELAARAGVSVFATGGLGGVHNGYDRRLDISADLGAFTRWPVAVVTSGVKSILDVAATRELLETLGVCVVGYQTDEFPAFYRRSLAGVGRVDARFDDVETLAKFVRFELARTNRGIVVCNPIPAEHELDAGDWARWLGEAEAKARAGGAAGRGVTPAVLAALHEVSGGATLRANVALVESNTSLAARIAARM